MRALCAALLLALAMLASAVNSDILVSGMSDSELNDLLASAAAAIESRGIASGMNPHTVAALNKLTQACAAVSGGSKPPPPPLPPPPPPPPLVPPPLDTSIETDEYDVNTVVGAIAQQEVLLVMFYSPRCSHCHDMMPELDITAQKMAARGYPNSIAKVDITADDGTTAGIYGVKRFPKIALFKDGEQLEEYTGRRLSGPIMAFLDGYAPPKAMPPTPPAPAKPKAAGGNAATATQNGGKQYHKDGRPYGVPEQKGGRNLVGLVRKDETAEALRYINELGWNPDGTGDGGVTALSLAAQKKNEAVIDALIAVGANPNVYDKNGWSPLLIGLVSGADVDIISKLIDAGSDLTHRVKDGWTCLHMATSGTVDAVDVLLDNDDVDIDAISDIGYTALHSAAENGSLEMVQMLIEAQADVTIKDSEQKTATDVAAEQFAEMGGTGSWGDVVEALTKAGQPVTMDFSDVEPRDPDEK